MKCYDPSEQVFNLKDKIISIDWGKGRDKAVQLEFKKENDGKLVLIGSKIL